MTQAKYVKFCGAQAKRLEAESNEHFRMWQAASQYARLWRKAMVDAQPRRVNINGLLEMEALAMANIREGACARPQVGGSK